MGEKDLAREAQQGKGGKDLRKEGGKGSQQGKGGTDLKEERGGKILGVPP